MLSLNKSYKNRKVSLTIHCKYEYFHSTVQRAEDRGQRARVLFLPAFAVCRKPASSLTFPLHLTTQKEEALSQHAARAEKKRMKRKIYQQRNSEIQSKTYI